MSLEFQDSRGVTFCCEGPNAPSSVEEGNANGWSGCNGGAPYLGACTPAFVGPPAIINTVGRIKTPFSLTFGNKYPSLLDPVNRRNNGNCGCNH